MGPLSFCDCSLDTELFGYGVVEAAIVRDGAVKIVDGHATLQMRAPPSTVLAANFMVMFSLLRAQCTKLVDAFVSLDAFTPGTKKLSPTSIWRHGYFASARSPGIGSGTFFST
jgi:hypothetical protein